MATLDFRGWRITSEPDCWVLGKPKLRLNKKQQQEVFLEKPSYHARLEHAIASLLEKELRESDAKSAAELLALLKEMKQEVKELIPF